MKSLKNILILLCFISIIICGNSVFADEISKKQKLVELMKLSGMTEIIEQARGKNKTLAAQYKEQTMEQISQGFEITDQKIWDKFEAEYQEFIDKLEPKWTVEEAVEEYTKLYGERMTEEEIDIVLEFSRSEVGKKSTKVSKEIAPIWYDYLAKDSEKEFGEATQEYISNLKIIIEDLKKNKQK